MLDFIFFSFFFFYECSVMLGTAVAVTHLGLGPPVMGHHVDLLVKVVALSIVDCPLGRASSHVVESSVVSISFCIEHLVFARILA